MEKNMNWFLRILVSSILIMVSNVSNADDKKTIISTWNKLEVIEDRGGQSIHIYLPGSKASDERRRKRRVERLSKKLVHTHFPVVTKSMRVGKITELEAKDINYQYTVRPMFIIGYDSVSINWLKRNRTFLIEKEAIGLVVNVDTKEQMNYLQEVAGSVVMQPTPGDRMSKHLKIRHYPFYLDNQGVMR